MTKASIQWTTQQRSAIAARGDVIVSASAGTGKTAVLSRRCIELLSDAREPVDINQLLVMTFTKAAAEEMRERIYLELRRCLRETHHTAMQDHLRRQLLRIDHADITTIHAFCKKVISEHFHALGLDPSFRLIDADEQHLLKRRLVEDVLESYWQGEHAGQLAELVQGRKIHRNAEFISLLLSIDEFLTNVVSPKDWLARAQAAADAAQPMHLKLLERQKSMLTIKLADCLNQLDHARLLSRSICRRVTGDKEGKNDFEDYILDVLRPVVEDCLAAAQSGKLGCCRELIRGYEKSRWPNTPKWMDKAYAERVKGQANDAIKEFVGLAALAVVNQDYQRIVAGLSLSQTHCLVDLAGAFHEAYQKHKRRFNCLDFSDLEHLCLKLLNQEGTGEPSAAARLLQRQYRYVIVDEYQDINPVQQAILERLSAGKNLFCVGDIKQSVYGFRGAEPDIFKKRLDLLRASDEPSAQAIDLNVNFRSHRHILEFVNHVFRRIMQEPLGSLCYDDQAALQSPSTRGDDVGEAAAVCVYILDSLGKGAGGQDDENDDEKQTEDNQDEAVDELLKELNGEAAAGNADTNRTWSASQKEAAFIAREIQRIVEGGDGKEPLRIFDKAAGTRRGVRYGDIAILTRAMQGAARDLTEMLRLAGIPVASQVSGGFFEATEIADVLALLKILDNPQQDVELAALLRSPFFQLNDDDLLAIRSGRQEERGSKESRNYFQCLLDYAQHGPVMPLRERLAAIVAQLSDWRARVYKIPLSDLVWSLLRETGYLSFAGALPNGAQRRANLLKLHERAIQFEGFAGSNQGHSLAGFIEFISEIVEAQGDWAPAEPDSSQENAVRIMTVHKSKGLEYPVVFLANLDRHFNEMGQRRQFLLDAENTLGLEIFHDASRSKLSNLAHQVIQESLQQKNLAEEMRILYVAMTRARDYLYLVASDSAKQCRGVLMNYAESETPDPVPRQLAKERSHWRWILHGLADQAKMAALFEIESEQIQNRDLEGVARIEFVNQETLNEIAASVSSPMPKEVKATDWNAPAGAKEAVPVEIQTALKHLEFKYPWQSQLFLPAKTSVTALTHQEEMATPFAHEMKLCESRPRTLDGGFRRHVSGALIGSATHLVLQHVDLNVPVDSRGIERTVSKLLEKKQLSPALAEVVDNAAIESFFETPLGQSLLRHPEAVRREWSFTTSISQRELDVVLAGRQANPADHDDEKTNDDTMIVQGIIDMLFRNEGELTIVDFKTDRVDREALHSRVAYYRAQLGLYHYAAEKVFRVPVAAKYLYFVSLRELVTV